MHSAWQLLATLCAQTTSHSSGVLLRHHLPAAALGVQVVFDIGTLSIPDVSYRTARILGIPLPPIFRIAIVPKSLQVDCAAAAVAASHPLNWTSAICMVPQRETPLQFVFPGSLSLPKF